MVLSPGASCLAHSLSITLEMLSGPIAFDTFIFCKSFSTPGVVMFSSGRLCLNCLFKLGGM